MADITANYNRGNPFSRQANASIQNVKPDLRETVRLCIATYRNGLIAEELEDLLGLSRSTVSARMTELKALNQIVSTGEKRKTRSGRNAGVWRVA